MVPGDTADVPGARTEIIGLARGPVHYDILLPLTPELREAFGFANAAGLPMQHPKAKWLVLGWGAAGYATMDEGLATMAPAALWRAATGDAAVLRIDLAGDVGAIAGLVWIEVSPAQIAALRDAILAQLARNGDDQPVAISPATLGKTHVFFHATGRFNIFYTCNAWVGETLRAAGIRLGIWTPTTQALSLSLWWNG